MIFVGCVSEAKNDCNYITDYYQTVYKADLEFQTENYKKAFELYQDAFNSCEPINTPTYDELGNFAETCAILGKNELAFEFIKKQIRRGYEIKWLQQNSNFDNIFKTEKGITLLAEYDNLKTKALLDLNLALREEIKKMLYEDQKYRNGNYQEFIDKQEAIDKFNTNRIIEIFNKIGYPNESVIGSFSVDSSQTDIGILLLHTSDSIRMSYFVPKLKEYVENGTCSPSTLGKIIDQYYLYNGEPQIYGTYQSKSGGYANMTDDLKKVDSNRISIGLAPLKLKEKKDSIIKVKYEL